MGNRIFFHGQGHGEQKSRAVQLGTQILTSPGPSRAKAPVARDEVGHSCGWQKTAPRSLAPSSVGMGHGMCLWGLGSRELYPPAIDPDTHLSRGSQGQGSGGQRCGGGWLQVWGDCCQVLWQISKYKSTSYDCECSSVVESILSMHKP